MSSTAAVSGFIVFLLSVQVYSSDWGVTYDSTEICALKGSTVEIRCTYTYPSSKYSQDTRVENKFWFTKLNGAVPVDLRRDSQYSGRVEYGYNNNDCTLTITDLRESDSAEYKFRFIINQPGGSYTGLSGVTLSVTDSDLQVERQYSNSRRIECRSVCDLPDHPSYIWYRNGEKIQGATSSSYYYYLDSFNYGDSYSCALRGREDFPSPPVCLNGQTCNKVTYTHRSICAFKGSSVDISCTYSSYDYYYYVESKFWFSPERSRQWQNRSQPEDISKDSQYAGRVQVRTERGRSTLRITDLTERDSAQYHFKFRTRSFEWRSSLPGTTLTITALQVQVTRIKVHQYYTEAELKCHSSCNPAGQSSYVWFKNGEKINWVQKSSHKGWFLLGDIISCALKGRETYVSPPVYAPKLPSVSVSPSGEIAEGSSVTLSCSSDANPAANYTWYKENVNVKPLSEEAQLVFWSIQSSDSGEYYCAAENELGRRTSQHVSIDVKYAPEPPSVSVSPSGEIVEGSSVTLSCDANPAANYTWYKENEDSPKASGQNFTITDFRAEHSGNYYCEAQNKRGHHNSTIYLLAMTGKSTVMTNIIRLTLVVVILIPLLLICLWMRRKTTSTTEANEPMETMELESDPNYTNASAMNSVTAACSRRLE